uniref:Uncharacterized protein n=1 Tax=Rhizophagus irregularis (strain DAOM 181602 / DAOM 197198 / MUCL 43194) TaxID=747089 RepID=U9UKU0_RHIID
MIRFRPSVMRRASINGTLYKNVKNRFIVDTNDTVWNEKKISDLQDLIKEKKKEMLSTINLELWKVTIHTKEVDGKFDKKLKKLMNRPHMEINSCKELSQQNVQVKCILCNLLSGDIESTLSKLEKPLGKDAHPLILWTREVCRHFIFYYRYGGFQTKVLVIKNVHSYSHARLIYWMICNRKQIEFWRITLKYDGLYQLVFLVEMTFPTEVAEFLVIISVMERCYELKFHFRSWFLKLSKSSMKAKVPVINIQTSQNVEHSE